MLILGLFFSKYFYGFHQCSVEMPYARTPLRIPQHDLFHKRGTTPTNKSTRIFLSSSSVSQTSSAAPDTHEVLSFVDNNKNDIIF